MATIHRMDRNYGSLDEAAIQDLLQEFLSGMKATLGAAQASIARLEAENAQLKALNQQLARQTREVQRQAEPTCLSSHDAFALRRQMNQGGKSK